MQKMDIDVGPRVFTPEDGPFYWGAKVVGWGLVVMIALSIIVILLR